MRFLSKRMHLTNSSWPSNTRIQMPYSMSHKRIELSELPLTTKRSLYCKHAIPRLCPFSVLTNSQDVVFHTLMVRSPEADTIYLSSKSTTFTAARWPTNTLRNEISVFDTISQTAIDRSCNQHQKRITPIEMKPAIRLRITKNHFLSRFDRLNYIFFDGRYIRYQFEKIQKNGYRKKCFDMRI